MGSSIGPSNFQQPPSGKKLIPKLKERTALPVPDKKMRKSKSSCHLKTQKPKI